MTSQVEEDLKAQSTHEISMGMGEGKQRIYEGKEEKNHERRKLEKREDKVSEKE
jgi:hypothetical protein